jgi:CheY-like chemotaxis protein
MSHELRSPLNAILGFTQLTNRNQTLPSDARENLGVVLRSGEHLLALINQVLELSKIEAGHMTLNETAFDLYRLFDDLEDMFFLAATGKGLKLVFARADDTPQYIYSDATKLRQTLINLIGNAIKFTTTGKINIGVKKLADAGATDSASLRLEFEVEDTGPGISADDMPMLFDAFVQTSTGHKVQEGTGLGLTISRSFVHLMGGDIRVQSKVGQGTKFAFDVACRTAPGVEIQPAHLSQRIVGLAPDQPQYRIMVVDDNWTNRQLILKLLEPLGFEMLEAENGKEAVEFAQTFQPHLIWMDIRMPVMDGLEATKRLKATPIGSFIKIVALTASVYDEERDDVIAIGCDEFVRKPIHEDRLFEILNRQLGVIYIYEDVASPQDVPAGEPLPLDELKTALSAIPTELIVRLSEGISLGDVAVIERTIAEIREHDVALAEALRRLAHRFQFEELLTLLREEIRP